MQIYRTEKLLQSKGHINRVKRQPATSHVNSLFPKYIRRSFNPRLKKKKTKHFDNPIKNLAKDLNRHFSKEHIQVANRYMQTTAFEMD